MKMYVGTEWSDRPRTVPVINPFDGSQINTVPRGNADDVDIAIATATRGAEEMARLPGLRALPNSASSRPQGQRDGQGTPQLRRAGDD